jgi:hypothetical protein
MRSDRSRSQATRAAAAAPFEVANREATLPALRRRASATLRPVLLANVCLASLAMLTPGAAQTVDGTWTGGVAPLPNEWTQGTNWTSSPTVPDRTATFTNNGAPTAVTISNTTSINTIQFTSSAPAYAFSVNGALLSIDGAGIVNASASTPTFTNNGAVTFTNASSAGTSAFVTNGGFLLSFTDTSTAGTATITTNSHNSPATVPGAMRASSTTPAVLLTFRAPPGRVAIVRSRPARSKAPERIGWVRTSSPSAATTYRQR